MTINKDFENAQMAMSEAARYDKLYEFAGYLMEMADDKLSGEPKYQVKAAANALIELKGICDSLYYILRHQFSLNAKDGYSHAELGRIIKMASDNSGENYNPSSLAAKLAITDKRAQLLVRAAEDLNDLKRRRARANRRKS
jgi:hypothetical protein